MMLVTGVLALVAGFLLAPVLSHGNPETAGYYRIAFCISALTYVGISYSYALQPRHLSRWNEVRTVQPVLTLLILCVLWLLKALTLNAALFTVAVTLLLQLGWGYWHCRRNALAPGHARISLLRPLGAYGIAQVAALAPARVNAQLDQLVLSQIVAAAVLGQYAIAVSLTSLPIPLVAAIGNVAFPRLAAQRGVTDATWRMQRNALLASAGIAAALLVPLAAVAYWMIPFLFGAGYRSAVPLLWILTPGAIFLACGQVAGDLLRGRNQPAAVAWTQGLAAVITVGLLIALLPVVGVYGAAIASTIAYGAALAAMLRSLRRVPQGPSQTERQGNQLNREMAGHKAAGRFRASLTRMSLRDILIAGACGICLIAILAPLPRVLSVPGNLWLATLWLTWLASLAWALTRRSLSIIFTALMLSMFIFIVAPATSAQLYGGTTIAGNNYQAGVGEAIKIAVLAQVAMLAGAMGARALRPVRGFDRIDVSLSAGRLDRAAIIAVAVALSAPVGMIVLGGAHLRAFFVYTSLGGYGTFWNGMSQGLGFLVSVQCVAGLAIVLLPLQLSAPSSRRVLQVAVALLASLVLLGSGQRGPFVLAVSAAGLVWLKTSKRRIRQRRTILIGALLLLLITAVLGVARGAAADREVTFGKVMGQPFGPGNNLFLPLAGLATTVPADIPYLHGESYLQIFVLPIPRAAWPDKPADDITVVTTAFDPFRSGLYFPAFGEGYANFGLPGVALIGIILGGLAELLHRRYASSRDIRASLVMAVEAGVLLQLFSRGSIAPMLTTYLGILVAARYISRRRSAVLAPVPTPWPDGLHGASPTERISLPRAVQ
jgi:oligosaccharide repeat unit polymerase